MNYISPVLHSEGMTAYDIKRLLKKDSKFHIKFSRLTIVQKTYEHFKHRRISDAFFIFTSLLDSEQLDIISMEEYQKKFDRYQNRTLLGVSNNYDETYEIMMALTALTIEDEIPGEYRNFANTHLSEEIAV